MKFISFHFDLLSGIPSGAYSAPLLELLPEVLSVLPELLLLEVLSVLLELLLPEVLSVLLSEDVSSVLIV